MAAPITSPSINDIQEILTHREKMLLSTWPNAQRIAVQDLLTSGYSSAKVIRAIVWIKEDGREYQLPPKIIKLGPRQMIEAERCRWEKYVNGHLDPANHAHIQGFLEQDDLAAIEYSLFKEYQSTNSFKKTFFIYPDVVAQVSQIFEEILAPWCSAQNCETRSIDPRQFIEKWLGGFNPISSQKIQKISDFMGQNGIDPLVPGLYIQELRRTIPNPIPLLITQPCKQAMLLVPWGIVHGDLNSENIRISVDNQICLIDFYHTGPAPAVSDFAKLESVLKFELLDRAALDTGTNRLLQIEDILITNLSPTIDEITHGATPGVQKTMKAIAVLRDNLSRFFNSFRGIDREIFWLSLFCNALSAASYDTLNPIQRIYAIVSAGLIAEHQLFPRKLLDDISSNFDKVSLTSFIFPTIRSEQDPIVEAEKDVSFNRDQIADQISRRIIFVAEHHHNLPPRTALVGRTKELAKLLVCLEAKRTNAIIGDGGIGKTVLAIEAGYQSLLSGVIDNVIWLSIDSDITTRKLLLRRLASVLYIDAISLSKDQVIDIIGNELQRLKVLLIIDNVEFSPSINVALEELAKYCIILITTRKMPQTLEHWNVIDLPPFTQEETNELIRKISGNKTTLDSELSKRIYKQSGGFPFLIEIIFAQLSQSQLKPMSYHTSRLQKALNPMNVVRHTLEELSEQALLVLYAISVFHTPLSPSSIELVSGLDSKNFRAGVEELLRNSLVRITETTQNSEERLYIHPYVRSSARKQLNSNSVIERDIQIRLFRYLKHFVSGLDERDPIYYKRIDAELENLLALLKWAHRNQLWDLVIDVRMILSRHLFLRGLWKERLECGKFTLEAARETKDDLVEAWALLDDLGWTLVEMEEIDEAKPMIEAAKKIFTRTRFTYGKAKALRHLEAIERLQGNLETANQLAQDTLNEAENIDSEELKVEMIAATRYVMGEAYTVGGQLVRAQDEYLRSYNLYSTIGDVLRRVKIYSRYGDCLRSLDKTDPAQRIYEIGIVRAIQLDRLDEIGYNLRGLANVSLKKGFLNDAERYAIWGSEVFRYLGKPDISAEMRRLLNVIRSRASLNVYSESVGNHV